MRQDYFFPRQLRLFIIFTSLPISFRLTSPAHAYKVNLAQAISLWDE
jgi:hypothetical protein